MKKILVVLLALMTFTTLTACSPDKKYDIYVTVYPMQYLVEAIGGDTVSVGRVPGSTVHSDSIDWSGKEIINMAESDFIFYVNGGVDTYIPDNADSNFSDGSVELVDVSEFVTYNKVCYTDEHSHLIPGVDVLNDCDENSLSDDPHFWLDPLRMLQAAVLVKDKLIEKYPKNTDIYESNFEFISASLTKLEEEFIKMSEETTKPIITTAMLFTYWYERYDIEILSITTSAHSSESNPGDIIEFVEEAEIHSIHYILFEQSN